MTSGMNQWWALRSTALWTAALLVLGGLLFGGFAFVVLGAVYAIPLAVVIGLPVAGGCIFGYGALWGIAERLDAGPRRVFVAAAVLAPSVAVVVAAAADVAA